MSNVIIRKATIEDFEILVSLRIELLKYENSLNSKNKFNEARIEKSKELIKTYLGRSNSVFFIAIQNEEMLKMAGNELGNENVVAYIHGTKDENPDELEGYIQGLFVAEKFRGKGIGGKLLAELQEWFSGKKHGLTTDVNNKNTIEFYEKHGYRIVEKDNQNPDVVFMVS